MENETETNELSSQAQPSTSGEPQSSAASRPRLWKRRSIIALASVSVGLLAAFWPTLVMKLGVRAPSPDAKTSKRPRFRRKKTGALASVGTLPQGFYLRQSGSRRDRGSKTAAIQSGSDAARRYRGSKSPAIHYVDGSGRIPFLREINHAKLKRVEPSKTSYKPNGPRVHFARASAIFELAALDRISNQQYSEACQMLINGIEHDLAFKQRLRMGPSVRLFDLLAVVAVRRDEKQSIESLKRLAKDALPLVEQQSVGPPAQRRPGTRKVNQTSTYPNTGYGAFRRRRVESFEERIKKWTDPTSKWQVRIKDPEKKVVWHVTIAPDTTNGKNERKRFEIAGVTPPGNKSV